MVALNVEVLAPPENPVASIIWLHGMGQEPGVMMDAAHRMGLVGHGVRNVFPAAPRRMTARTKKGPVRAWFQQDVFALHSLDIRGALDMEEELRSLVAHEAQLVGHQRVIMAGFSQGAVAALMLGMRYPGTIAGLLLYACYLPRELESLLVTHRGPDVQVPVWLGHGTHDYVIPISVGERLRDTLAAWGHPVSWQPYPARHEAFAEVRGEADSFLDDAIGLSRVRP